jgi:hypothetical protein
MALPVSLEEEIKRMEAEIDKIFAYTLAQPPSISGEAGSQLKRGRVENTPRSLRNMFVIEQGGIHNRHAVVVTA